VTRILNRLLVVLAFAAVPILFAAALDRVAYAQGHAQAVESVQHLAPYTMGVVSVDDPTSTLLDLISFARSGKGRLAFGAGLVLLVWGLRGYVFARVKWLQTKLGGYVSGFGAAAILYVGVALGAGAELTVNMICDALVAGFAASGKWEAIADIADMAKRIPPIGKQVAAASVLAIVALSSTAMLATGPGCKTPIVEDAKHVVLPCVESQLDQLGDVKVGDLYAQLTAIAKSGAWSQFYDVAISHGVELGGCVAARVINFFTSPRSASTAPPVEQTNAARETLERLRAHFGGNVAWRDPDTGAAQ